MLDLRVPLINLLRHHPHWRGWSLELRPKHNRITPVSRLTARHPGWAGRQVAEDRLMNFGAGRLRDALDPDALVDDDCVVHRVVVDDGRAVIDTGDFDRREAAMGEVMVVETIEGDEGEMLGAQAKVKV